MKHFELGASIYVPTTHQDLTAIANEEKFIPRSVIFCTEDSVNESDLPKAFDNLSHMLRRTTKSEKMLKFIRVRNTEVFEKVLQMDGIEKIDGFVLPKITQYNFLAYHDKIKQAGFSNDQFYLMPTLETRETFSIEEMNGLKTLLNLPNIKSQILSLRIGGNDLLNILGIRRSRYRTIYETPLAVTISNLVVTFKPCGFNLTAPVCEFLQDPELLSRETPLDLEYGLFGKTAIHPDQIKTIEQFYKPNEHEVEMAEAMLKENAPAVFGMHGTMCEKATHSNWAREILHRAKIYGIFGSR